MKEAIKFQKNSYWIVNKMMNNHKCTEKTYDNNNNEKKFYSFFIYFPLDEECPNSLLLT